MTIAEWLRELSGKVKTLEKKVNKLEEDNKALSLCVKGLVHVIERLHPEETVIEQRIRCDMCGDYTFRVKEGRQCIECGHIQEEKEE